MVKATVVSIVVIASIFFAGCSRSSLTTQTELDKSSLPTCTTHGQIYDCAANSLYSLCQKSDIPISYQLCLELLPLRQEGNSMLEFKSALLTLDFSVEAQRLTADELANIQDPTVVLISPPEKHEPAKMQPAGHYLVLWPLDEISVQILDYPREPIAVSRDYWAAHLRRVGANSIPALLCGKQGQTLKEMLPRSEITTNSLALIKNVEEQAQRDTIPQ